MPTRHDVTNCPSCHGPIRWALTVNGKRQPVNADPDDKGNLACYTDGTGTLRSRVLTMDRPALDHIEWRAMPHVATCSGPPPRVYPQASRRRPVVRRGPWQGLPR
ncbi:hypothetical protein [Streptomyces sp. NPDC102487]|uniref:hypothetical protein n=1 Tax=Streptomyces sp. NPDC102487 TaxID=3366182 RepID=UPI0037FDA97A